MRVWRQGRRGLAIGAVVLLTGGAPSWAVAGQDADQTAAERQRERDEAQRERERERAQRDREREQNQRERIEDLYDDAQDALEEGQWTRALERFSRVVAAKMARVDAAMYWTAYAQSKLGQQGDALATLAELTKSFPSSRWIGDAKALDIEVRRSVGQPVRPEAQADEELKLLAIQGLQHSDPAQAVPMLQKFLQGPQSPRLKERALFVLAQSNSPQARQVLAEIAKGATQPDLQRKAIQYLGVNATQDNRQLLADIYTASTDVSVKRQILRAYMVAGDRARVLSAATGETSAELRQEAVRQLGVMGAREELRQLYLKESDVDVRRQILQALFVAGDSTRLVELANSETNAELRLAAVRHLGTMGSQRTGTALVTLYERDRDAAVKRAVINALFVQGNAESLVALARKETGIELKREMVQKLTLMTKSKVATDYLLEILGK
jgi:hypothetical protein